MTATQRLALLTLAFAFVLSYAPPSLAATITVDGTCSLANAIRSANTDTAVGGCDPGSGRDTIRLSGTILLRAGLPNIAAPVDITGPSGGYATIDGQDMHAIFWIERGSNPNIRNLILQNGASDFGGAMTIRGDATISNVYFRSNTSGISENDGGTPGAISVCCGLLRISDSTFTDNINRFPYHGSVILAFSATIVGRNLLFRRNGRFFDLGSDNPAVIAFETYLDNPVMPSTLTDVTFEGNNGPGVAVSRHNLTLNNVRFRNNGGTVVNSSPRESVTINCLLEFRNNTPNVIPSWVTINKCPGDGGSEPEPVVVSPEVTIAHNQAVIDEHGYGVTLEHGLGTISLRGLDPHDCGAIGNQAVCDMDVLQVADVSGWAEQGIRFCFKGYGQVLFVPSHDADRQPINQKTAQPETLPVEVDGEHICVTINRDGKLFLIDAPPLVTRTQAVSPVPYSPTGSGPAPETDCDLPPRLQAGDRAFRDGYDPSNLRSDAARTGQDIGDIRRGVVVTVIEGPVNRDNYNWYKVNRDGGGSGWIAESGDTDNGCGYFFGKVAAEEAAQETDDAPFVILPDGEWEGSCDLPSRLGGASKAIRAEGNFYVQLLDSSQVGGDSVDNVVYPGGVEFWVGRDPETNDEDGFLWFQVSEVDGNRYSGWVPEFGPNAAGDDCIYYLEPYVEPSEQAVEPEEATEIPDTVEPQEEEVDEAQTVTVLTTQTVPVLSQEEIENLPRFESRSADAEAVEELKRLAEISEIVEVICGAGLNNVPDAQNAQDALEWGAEAATKITEKQIEIMKQETDNPDLTRDEALALVQLDLANEIWGAGTCSFLGLAMKDYQNGVEGLPVMWQFYGPLYLAHGIDPRGEEAEKLLDPVPSCLMQSSQAVAGRAWPEADRAEVGRLRQGDNIQVYGKIKLPGQEEFYLTRGELAGEDGLMYIAASQVGLVGNCDDVVDLSPLADKLAPPERDAVGPLIINLPEGACKTFDINARHYVETCKEYRGADCITSLVNDARPDLDIAHHFTKITDDGWAYMEPVENPSLEHHGWVPAIRNAVGSTGFLALPSVALIGGVDYPDVSECLDDFYKE